MENKATYKCDFWGCWRVYVNGECVGEFATSADAKKLADKYNDNELHKK